MNAISKNISLNLRNLRDSLGWSLDKAAAQTGVSKAMLGQIERQESSPTIATLWKIAKGFHVPFSIFLEKPKKIKKDFKNEIASHWLKSSDGKMLVNPLFPFNSQLHCEMFVVQLLPKYEHVSVPHEKGVVEHVIVTSGAMEIFVNGVWNKFEVGEGIQFKADQKHGYRNLNSEPVTFHNIIHYPKLLKR